MYDYYINMDMKRIQKSKKIHDDQKHWYPYSYKGTDTHLTKLIKILNFIITTHNKFISQCVHYVYICKVKKLFYNFRYNRAIWRNFKSLYTLFDENLRETDVCKIYCGIIYQENQPVYTRNANKRKSSSVTFIHRSIVMHDMGEKTREIKKIRRTLWKKYRIYDNSKNTYTKSYK